MENGNSIDLAECKTEKKKAGFTGELSVLCGGLFGFLATWIAGGVFSSLKNSTELLLMWVVVAALGFTLFLVSWQHKRQFGIIFFALLCAASLYLHRAEIPFPEINRTIELPAARTAISTADINFRSEASGNSAIIKVLLKGTIVTISGEDSDGWAPVEYDGIQGWVSSSYIEVQYTEDTSSTEQVEAPPVENKTVLDWVKTGFFFGVAPALFVIIGFKLAGIITGKIAVKTNKRITGFAVLLVLAGVLGFIQYLYTGGNIFWALASVLGAISAFVSLVINPRT